jgi:hypothetical protein
MREFGVSFLIGFTLPLTIVMFFFLFSHRIAKEFVKELLP